MFQGSDFRVGGVGGGGLLHDVAGQGRVLGSGVQGSRFRVRGGEGCWGGGLLHAVVCQEYEVELAFWRRVWGLGSQVTGHGFKVQGAGSRADGLEFRVLGLGFRAQGSGFGVQKKLLCIKRLRHHRVPLPSKKATLEITFTGK